MESPPASVFLDNAAGFGILQSLIPYDETYTYGRTSLLACSTRCWWRRWGSFRDLPRVLHRDCATVAQLAGGAASATVYIETFLQHPAVAADHVLVFRRAAPALPRQSLSVGDSVFLNNRGLFLPRPIVEDGFWLVVAALLVAIIGAVLLTRWQCRRQEASGQQFPAGLSGIRVDHRPAPADVLGQRFATALGPPGTGWLTPVVGWR